VCRCVDVQVCRMCGCVDVWVCGFLGVAVP
jgi:hypothetical protein